jgi:hypothetical protein
VSAAHSMCLTGGQPRRTRTTRLDSRAPAGATATGDLGWRSEPIGSRSESGSTGERITMIRSPDAGSTNSVGSSAARSALQRVARSPAPPVAAKASAIRIRIALAMRSCRRPWAGRATALRVAAVAAEFRVTDSERRQAGVLNHGFHDILLIDPTRVGRYRSVSQWRPWQHCGLPSATVSAFLEVPLEFPEGSLADPV